MSKDLSPTIPFEKLKSSKAWKLFSSYIKFRDKHKCFTCKKYVKGKKLHAGHYIEKRGNAAIYFDEEVVHAQCFYCNRMLHGNKSAFAVELEKLYGAGILQELQKRARKTKHWTKNELEELAGKYKKKLEEIENV